jgi:hypothetical protein
MTWPVEAWDIDGERMTWEAEGWHLDNPPGWVQITEVHQITFIPRERLAAVVVPHLKDTDNA